MSDTMNQPSLGADVAIEELGVGKPPAGERTVAITYLTAVGVAMASWLYAIMRAVLAAVSWIFS